VHAFEFAGQLAGRFAWRRQCGEIERGHANSMREA
jgi:hypothetical protein